MQRILMSTSRPWWISLVCSGRLQQAGTSPSATGEWKRGRGRVAADLSGLDFSGSFSNRADVWTGDTPRLARVRKNTSALDLRGNRHYLTAEPWTGVYKGYETVSGDKTPRDGKWRAHFFRLGLVLGARNADELGIIEHFNGMLDEFRISAGQVRSRQLLSVR